MQIIQSYISAIFRASLSKYEQRIIIKMAEHGQSRVSGLVLSRYMQRLEHDYKIVQIDLPIKYLLDEGSKHYEYVWQAVQSLQSKPVGIRDTKSNTWFSAPIIMQARHDIGKGTISFLVPKVFYDALYDFTQGFRSYDLATAMSFNLATSARLYILMQGVKSPIKYSLPYLKQMFGVESLYKRNSDFIKRVITPAVAEIKACEVGTWFDVVNVKTGQTITHLEFIPHQRATESQKRAEPRAVVPLMSEAVRQLLMDHAGFTLRELSHHKPLLQSLNQLPHAQNVVVNAIQRARKKRAGKGYIINALRDECATK